MKMTRVIMCVMLLSMISTFAIAQDKKLEKDVKDRVKELKKEGWKVPGVGLPIEEQVRNSFKLRREVDSSYQPRYIIGYAISVGSLFNGAKGDATFNAKVFLAEQITTELTSSVNNMLSNKAISLEDAKTASNFIVNASTTATQRLYNIIPVIELYRENKSGNIEFQVELAYDKKKAFQQFIEDQESYDGNNQILLANYFGERFYKGNGVEQDGDEALKWFEIAAKEGSPKAQAMINSIEKSKPVIEWLSDDAIVNSNVYNVKAGIKSTSKIKRCEVTINGQRFRDLSVIEDDGYDLKIDKPVVLNKGQNIIVIRAKNDNGTTTIERNVTYDPTYNPNAQKSVQLLDKRIAMIVGNSNYKDSDKSLRNPKNDATDISEKLRLLGFDVMTITDANKQTIEQKLFEFGENAKTYDVALFYYAGHGIQNKGNNYLIPVDARLKAEDEIPYHCVDANLVLDKMESAGCKTKIVILDACRNNPFARSWHRGLGTESQGLSKMDAPNGIFIGYATGPGQVAQDGSGRNSPYTQALLKMLDEPNLTLGSFYIGVVNEVKKITNDQQWPWQSNSLDGEFYFNKKGI